MLNRQISSGSCVSLCLLVTHHTLFVSQFARSVEALETKYEQEKTALRVGYAVAFVCACW